MAFHPSNVELDSSVALDIGLIGGVSVVADDAAFTPGTSTGFTMFGFADETGTDSVDEGDVGAVRMTLDRKLIGASMFLEDAAAGDGDYGSSVLFEAEDPTSMATVTEGDYTRPKTSLQGETTIYNTRKQAGEDLSNDVQKIESRGDAFSSVQVDTQVSTTSGVLRSVTFSCADAEPTAGSIIFYDNTAESGTVLLTVTFTTAVFRAFTVDLNVPYSTGLYIGFTTTADVGVSINYRDDS